MILRLSSQPEHRRHGQPLDCLDVCVFFVEKDWKSVEQRTWSRPTAQGCTEIEANAMDSESSSVSSVGEDHVAKIVFMRNLCKDYGSSRKDNEAETNHPASSTAYECKDDNYQLNDSMAYVFMLMLMLTCMYKSTIFLEPCLEQHSTAPPDASL